MEHIGSDDISEALKLLDEAAKQKKDELKSVMMDKYTHLRSVIVDSESSLVRSLADARKHAAEAAALAKDLGVEKARDMADDLDKSVRSNPWPYIAYTAGVGVLLGYILGRNRE
jgi:ElaB/YqjD/DUF883 family membrane-anchored ribosome-binding protein